MNRFKDATTPDQIIAQAVGCGSMCWIPRPGDLEFDSEEADRIVDDALDRLAEIGVDY